MSFWRHYVYIHKTSDTGKVFYVGKGTIRKREKSVSYERAYYRINRSVWWNNMADKHGVDVEIIAMFSSNNDACSFEIKKIAEYGRKEVGGSLVNLTDGGEGHLGIIVSESLRAKRRINSSGKRSDAWVKSIRVSRKNGGNGGVVKFGDKLSDSWRENISKGVTGSGNSQYGKRGADASSSLTVIDDATGIEYGSITMAAEAIGIPMKRLHSYLRGYTKNQTTMRLA